VDNELEVIRHQMEAKRASLADKLDALENQVMDTVHETTAEVSSIVQDVKSGVSDVVDDVKSTVETVVDDVKSAANSVSEGVQETVESVKETIDIRGHIRENPWLAMGGAFALGFAGAWMMGPSARSRSRTSRWANGDWDSLASHGETPTSRPAPPRAVEKPEPEKAPEKETSSESTLSLFGEAGTEALHKIKGLAIGTLMGVLGEVAVRSLPETLGSEASKVVKDLTTRLGGKVLDVSGMVDSLTAHEKGDDNDHCNTPEMGRPMGSAQRPDQKPLGQPDRR
jgi:ElaB/YqjD/DUF883 family membrane-anchored ribosome-binding protein